MKDFNLNPACQMLTSAGQRTDSVEGCQMAVTMEDSGSVCVRETLTINAVFLILQVS